MFLISKCIEKELVFLFFLRIFIIILYVKTMLCWHRRYSKIL